MAKTWSSYQSGSKTVFLNCEFEIKCVVGDERVILKVVLAILVFVAVGVGWRFKCEFQSICCFVFFLHQRHTQTMFTGPQSFIIKDKFCPETKHCKLIDNKSQLLVGLINY